jgi:hypothetical protein
MLTHPLLQTVALADLLMMAALLGLVLTLVARVGWDLLAPVLCRRLGHKPRQLGLYVRVCDRCGRKVK